MAKTYSSAPLGSSQRSEDLLSAAKSMVAPQAQPTYNAGNTRNGVPIPDRVVVGGKSYAYDKAPTATIPIADTTTPVQSVTIPPQTAPTSPDATALAQQQRNIQLGLNADGTQTINPNTQTTAPTVAPVLTVGEKFAQDYGIPKVAEPKSVTEKYYSSDAYKNMVATQNRLTGLTGQLGAITASANQQQLALEGQGRGQTTAFLGGEGARIQREAAIASLPLQASIAAEQGNLDLAKSNLDTWSRLMIADAEAERAYKKEIRDFAIQVATTDQANKIKAADKIADQNFEIKKLGIQYDYSKRLEEAKDKTTPGDLGASYKSDVATTGIQAVNGMLDIARNNPNIFGKTAAIPLPNFVRSDAFRNYSAQLDFLKGNIIPAALSAMRDASKTGGALGQVSDREGAWLGSSLGALDMSQSPDQIQNQLLQIRQHLQTWQNAVNTLGTSTDNQTVTRPEDLRAKYAY